jgi:hypothetical protein
MSQAEEELAMHLRAVNLPEPVREYRGSKKLLK